MAIMRPLKSFPVLAFAVVILASLATGKQPNVLFIAVDDLRPELGCYGTRAITPHLDTLAASGLMFGHAYCNQAVCGASRLSLMSGLYPERTGERTFHVTDWRARHADVITLNQHFKANGYNTAGLGKIYHGTGGPGVDPKNWTEWIQVSGKVRGYALPENASIRKKQGTKRPPGNRGGQPKGPATESADVPDATYADGRRAEVAIEQLKNLARADAPFFLAVGFTKPHLPFVAPEKYWDLYKRGDFAMPSNPGVPPGYPVYARNVNAGELRSYSDCPKKGTPADFPDGFNRRLLHGYHACVSYMDAQVGKVLTALEQSGVADNTIVILWGDHGWKLGDHSSWCKHTNFECDTRVPLFVRMPGKTTPGTKTAALVELIDLYPTLCELTGLGKPAHLQGKSFAALLENPKGEHRKSAYSSYPHGAGRGVGKVVGHSIRSGPIRYTEWWKVGSDEVVAAVATNMEADPGETKNLLPKEDQLGKRLSSILKKRVLSAR
jgi:arylsulfatase A-like enzyme